MLNKNERLRMTLSWLAPSVSELIIYVIIALVTLFVSNITFVRDFVYAPQGLNIKDLVLDSISSSLDRFVGVGPTRTAVVIIFWALVGLLVYALIWVFSNFSDELGNDIALTKYAHPRNVDTSSPLRTFLSRTLFRLMILLVFIFYLNVFWKALVPFFVNHFKLAVDTWPAGQAWRAAIIGIVFEVIALHVFVVLTRLLLLKKRIFD